MQKTNVVFFLGGGVHFAYFLNYIFKINRVQSHCVVCIPQLVSTSIAIIELYTGLKIDTFINTLSE